ncbi:MAG: protein-L-isoaspartate O-methyltransferase [Magnetococcus sp. DMHC-8]
MDFSLARTNMVKSQLAPNGVDNPLLLDAFRLTPREPFVIDTHKEFAYSDHALPLDARRRALKPLQVARLLQSLTLDNGDRILVVGAGTGYEAALLASLPVTVFALESDPRLAEQGRQLTPPGSVQWHVGDLVLGWPEQAPFDGILICGAIDAIPNPLLAQLSGRGELVAIVGQPGEPVMRAVRVRGGRDQQTDTLFETVAFPLVVEEHPQSFRL